MSTKELSILFIITTAIVCLISFAFHSYPFNENIKVEKVVYPKNLIVITRSYDSWQDYLTYIIDTTYNVCLVKHFGIITCVPCSTLWEGK